MQPAAPSQPAALGPPVGDYRLGRSLGQGHLGAVYEATHQQSGQTFAIKLLLGALSRGPQVAARFPYEARAVSLVNHASLCEVREFGVMSDGTAFLVMEHLVGETLRARLSRTGRVDEGLALTYGRQLARALATAHGVDIFHGNLKPENVLIVRDPWKPDAERVKIMDLGLLRIATGGGDSGALARSIGSPPYLAPEQRAGHHAGPEADVYALGVMIYEMLAGQLPCPGETIEEVEAAAARGAPPLRELADPMIPDEMVGLVERMMTTGAQSRPRMQEVAEELDRLDAYKATRAYAAVTAQGPPSAPQVPGRGTMAWARVVLQQRQEARRKDKDSRSRRQAEDGRGVSRRAMLGVLGGAIALALGGGTAVILRRPAEPDVKPQARKDPPPERKDPPPLERKDPPPPERKDPPAAAGDPPQEEASRRSKKKKKKRERRKRRRSR